MQDNAAGFDAAEVDAAREGRSVEIDDVAAGFAQLAVDGMRHFAAEHWTCFSPGLNIESVSAIIQKTTIKTIKHDKHR